MTARTHKTQGTQLQKATVSGLALFSILACHPTFAATPPHLLDSFKSFENFRDALQSVKSEPTIQSILNRGRANALSVLQINEGQEIQSTKFQHYYEGLEVVGSMAIHHRIKTSLQAAATQIRNRIAEFDLDTRPSLDAEAVVSLAKSLVGDRELAEAPSLKILPNEENSASLVYWVKLKANEFDGARELIIDAHSGQVIGNLSDNLTIAPIQIYSARNKGLAVTLVQGPKDAKGNPTLKECRVKNLATGQTSTVTPEQCNIVTQNQCQLMLEGDPEVEGTPLGVNPAQCTLTIANGAKVGQVDQSAQNAYRNSSAVLTYFQNVHKRNSFDGRGAPVISVIHAGDQYSNAHWSVEQKIMVYGDGDGKVLGDFSVALDVAGHEMTHGLTSHTAKLLMMGESGALNEAYSDFFGKMIDFNGDWAIGRKLFLNPAKAPGVRDMANPHNLTYTKFDANGNPIGKAFYPVHMREKAPTTGTCDALNDNCWVHINATIPGHASYRIVQAIGKEKAERLYFVTLTQNLTARDNFKSMAQATLGICGQLFDKVTCEKVKTEFAAVGL